MRKRKESVNMTKSSPPPDEPASLPQERGRPTTDTALDTALDAALTLTELRERARRLDEEVGRHLAVIERMRTREKGLGR